MTQAQFLRLWRDAMFGAEPRERCRLTLELGRAVVRETGHVGVLLVAVVEGRDDPLMVLPMKDPPRQGSPVREAVVSRLGEVGASEVYLLLTARTESTAGPPAFLLACWGETVGGAEVAWMMPYRHVAGRHEEAAVFEAPEARETRLSADLAGLVPSRH